jgi:hypothetical protein
VHGGRGLALPHLLEEENERRRDEANNAEEPEVVRVSHEQGLLPENPMKDLRRSLHRAPRSLMGGQPVEWRASLDRPSCIPRSARRRRPDSTARLDAKSRQTGDPYAPAEVAREIEDAAGVANLVLLERATLEVATGTKMNLIATPLRMVFNSPARNFLA